jgi:uncharacterized membrane protein YfcA
MDGMVERIGVFALVGLGSGFVSGLFGIGGGIVRIPLFVYLLPLFGVAQSVMMHVAVGTSMALVLPSAIAATRKPLALGNLDLAFFRTWALGILIGVLIGIHLAKHGFAPGAIGVVVSAGLAGAAVAGTLRAAPGGPAEAASRLQARAPERGLSPAALEALAVVAYLQPIGRPEIARIRGVSSDAVVAGLLERELIEEAGRGDGLGSPVLYRTTTVFERIFGLDSLAALPRAGNVAGVFVVPGFGAAAAGLGDQTPLADALRDKAAAFVDEQLVKQGLLDKVGGVASPQAKTEVGYERRTSIPTAGVIVKACLDDCSACEPELEKKIDLELQRLDLQNKLLAKQIELLEKSQEYRCCPDGEEEEPTP